MPSGANSGLRNSTNAPTYFLDRQIGRYVVSKALVAAGAIVEVHDDHFHQATPDLVWIPEVARRNWVLITKDQNIRRNPLERAAYEESRLRGFILTSGEMLGADLASLLVACLPRMNRRVRGASGPLLYTISRSGHFTLMR